MLYLHEEVSDFSQQVLRTDAAGMPLEWIDYRDAVRLYYLGQVAYSCGSPLFRVHGGYQRPQPQAELHRGQLDRGHGRAFAGRGGTHGLLRAAR